MKHLKDAQSEDASKIDSIVSMESIAQITDLYGENRTNLADEIPYSDVTVGGGAVNICVKNTYGRSNKLSNHKYIKFTTPSNGNYEIQATQTDGNGGEAVIDIYKTSPFTSIGSYNVPYENTFTAGEHLIDISNGINRDTCFDVTIIAK